MESFDYIESGIVFGLDSKNNLRTFNKHSVDFSVHGGAYKFVIKYFDDYGEFPSESTLVENFPSLDPSPSSLKWEYENIRDKRYKYPRYLKFLIKELEKDDTYELNSGEPQAKKMSRGCCSSHLIARALSSEAYLCSIIHARIFLPGI